MNNKAVFLDRDGVLNKPIIRNGKPYPPADEKEFEIYDDALTSLNQLKERGFCIIVVTNQPDILRGLQSSQVVDKFHKMLNDALPIDHIEMCIDENGSGYKPLPGMIVASAKKFFINIKNSYMIGDRWRDIGAGVNAGCKKNILIDRGYSEKMLYTPDYICISLAEAVEKIIQIEGGTKQC